MCFTLDHKTCGNTGIAKLTLSILVRKLYINVTEQKQTANVISSVSLDSFLL